MKLFLTVRSPESVTISPVTRTVVVWFAGAMIVLCSMGWLGRQSLFSLQEDTRQIAKTHEFIAVVNDTLSEVTDVQSSVRGYLLTTNREYLEPYHAALPLIHQNLERLKLSSQGDAEQLAMLQKWRVLIDERIAAALHTIEVTREEGLDAGIALFRQGIGTAKMKEVRNMAAQIEADQLNRLAHRTAVADASTRWVLIVSGIGLVVCFGILCAVFWVIHQESQRREAVETVLQQSHQELASSLSDLRRITAESRVVTTMADFLQSCHSPQEAYSIIGRNIPRLLPEVSGAIGIISNSRNLVELVFSWGDHATFGGEFQPDDCWGLRRGRMHNVADTDGCEPLCHHISTMPLGYLCLPMVAHGETLGVLSISSDRPGGLTTDEQKAARTVAEQASLALANLRLQDALRVQSIRDPLTGLFNRRYLEASLERELIRAKRQNQNVVVIMIDVDHFKRFNDTHGHEGGDALLANFGKLLNQMVRGDDIPCRYGGEEFCLILPAATLPAAVERAEALRQAVKKMTVRYRQQPLGPVSISVGLAIFPEHSESGEAILQVADTALYQAKKSGRDRVVIAGTKASELGRPTSDEINAVLESVLEPESIKG